LPESYSSYFYKLPKYNGTEITIRAAPNPQFWGNQTGKVPLVIGLFQCHLAILSVDKWLIPVDQNRCLSFYEHPNLIAMLIRNADLVDLPMIVEIYNSTVNSHVVTADVEPVSVVNRLAWFHAHEVDCYPLWVLDVDGAIAGWLGFQPFYGRPAYRHTAELSVYVAATHRRQGVGQKLLAKAIATGPTIGITTLLGFIFADNYPSLQLFAQFDFQTWGCLPKVAKFEHSAQDLVIVGKTLL
jgi:L-amino acid N-acyltransferase YncA